MFGPLHQTGEAFNTKSIQRPARRALCARAHARFETRAHARFETGAAGLRSAPAHGRFATHAIAI